MVETNPINMIPRLSLKTIHFAKNPAKGGIPARLAIISTLTNLFLEILDKVLVVFSIFSLSKSITKITEIQYNIEKEKNKKVFNMILNIIHLKLKTEESAKISIILVLFIWRNLPINIDKITKGKIEFFFWNKRRYTGANFCQVIRNSDLNHFEFLTIVINHWWKGEEAALIIIETSPNNQKIWLLVYSLVMIIENTKIAEVIDWIIKYFILISVKNPPVFFLCFIKVQKERVLSSKAIHTTTHLFLKMHNNGLVTKITIIELFVLISRYSNCKFDRLGNKTRFAVAFYVLKTYSFINLKS